jgi:hypothetical protein
MAVKRLARWQRVAVEASLNYINIDKKAGYDY